SPKCPHLHTVRMGGGVVHVIASNLVVGHVAVQLLGVKVGQRAVEKATQRVAAMLEVVHQLGHDVGVEGDHDAIHDVGDLVHNVQQLAVELQRYGSAFVEGERKGMERM